VRATLKLSKRELQFLPFVAAAVEKTSLQRDGPLQLGLHAEARQTQGQAQVPAQTGHLDAAVTFDKFYLPRQRRHGKILQQTDRNGEFKRRKEIQQQGNMITGSKASFVGR
jgi:hypothetical protein